MIRVCHRCGEPGGARAYYKGRKWVCKKCLRKANMNNYTIRTLTRKGEFTCRNCGGVYPPSMQTSAIKEVCRKCYNDILLLRKAEAPDMLTCRGCGETKPKEDFEKYSVTRCKMCANRKSREYYHHKKVEV